LFNEIRLRRWFHKHNYADATVNLYNRESEVVDENKEYGAEQIQVLDGLEAVRKRPSMYIGNTSEEGLHHLIWEIVDNSIDEALAGFCNQIFVIIHEDNFVSVEDNGRGIPVEKHPTENMTALELVMTTLHAGGKFDHQSYKVSGGLHGVGVSVVNALSTDLSVEIKRNKKIYRQKYQRGIVVSELEVVGESEKTGTKISFRADSEIFMDCNVFNYETVKNRLRELSYLNKDLRIYLKDERTGEEDRFHASGGLTSYVEYLNRNRTTVFDSPIYIQGSKDNVEVEIALQHFDGYSERLFSFVNNINTKEGGSHVVGFRSALTKCINRYANDDMIPKNMREKMGGDDVREGLTCVISVKVANPQFEGQTKTKLGNSEVKSVVESICSEKLTLFLEQNPGVAKRILAKVVEAARAREAAKRARDLSRKKGSTSILMAGKLAECQEKDPSKREIFIVEGDSAGGSAKQGRDRSNQAILPLRGKILNVEKARFDRILSSDEIKHLISALGCGIGNEDFDINNLRYHKIIIMTDADVDGAHIRTLLLTFFYRQMTPLVENGFVYIGQPPLFRLGKGKSEFYFHDEKQLNSFLFEQSSQQVTVTIPGVDQKLLEGAELKSFLEDLASFSKLLDFLSRLNLQTDLLVSLFENNVKSADQFKDEGFVSDLKDKLVVDNIKAGVLRICRWRPDCYEFDIVLNMTTQTKATIGPNLPLISEYRSALGTYNRIKSLLSSEYVLTFAGKGVSQKVETASSWTELLKKIKEESFKGSHLQRYKGLGEMNPDQLWETTMNPTNRNLLKVTIEDTEKADEIFSTLMGDKVEPRRDFIQSHALEIDELDI
jgi:DNA gyrase subunit B